MRLSPCIRADMCADLLTPHATDDKITMVTESPTTESPEMPVEKLMAMGGVGVETGGKIWVPFGFSAVSVRLPNARALHKPRACHEPILSRTPSDSEADLVSGC